MELIFRQNEQFNYEAEFKADGVFNLHIEKTNSGPISILQKGFEQGDYAQSSVLDSGKVFDYDFGALVYPKWIKVISGSEVIKAEVNFA